MRIPELLAPAGTYETLIAVCNAGADAVYAAGTKYGARAYAGNFSDDELLSAISYVHLHGKKFYLTLNTLIKNSEFNELYDYILPLYERGLDAVIVQDLGVVDYIRKQFPLLPVHISTQATVCGSDAVDFFNKQGCERVVLARELSLEEIREIKNNTNLELEIFVHGALCYSYSGMCFYSSLIGGRSGNRGRCAQPCRMSYSIKGHEKEYMSLKDLSALLVLDKICEAGVDSLKIEGRMKSTEYAAGVTSIYRKYLDILKTNPKQYNVLEKDIDIIEKLYQRRGFTEGYLFKHNGPEMLISNDKSKYVDILSDYVQKDNKVKVKLSAYFTEGEEAVLVLSDNNDNYVSVSGEICEKAVKKALDEDTVKDKLGRVNDTPLEISSMDIEINGDIFIPLSALNNLRRMAVEAYLDLIDSKFKREIPKTVSIVKNIVNKTSDRFYTASFLTFDQGFVLSGCDKIKRVYFPYDLYFGQEEKSLKLIDRFKSKGIKVYLSMPEIFRVRTKKVFNNRLSEINELFDGFLIKNIDELEFIKNNLSMADAVCDHTLYTFNSTSLAYLRNYYDKLTAPVELNFNELKNMDFTNGEIIIYGRYPMMYSANCLKKSSDKCTGLSDGLYYKDRKGMRFFVKSVCSGCYNIIYNSRYTSLLGVMEKVDKLNVSGLRYSFTDETKEQTEEIINNFNDPENFTRGHFIRGVE